MPHTSSHPSEFAARFAGLSRLQRLEALGHWSGRELAALYRLALAGEWAIAEPADWLGLGCEHYAAWCGKNPMPALLPWLSRFEKRFFSCKDGALWGHNHTAYMRFAGPGYFRVLPAEALPDLARYALTHPERHLVFDYTRIPGDVPGGFPQPASNAPQAVPVFAGLRDFVLPLGEDLLVGAAFTTEHPEKPIAHFALLRPGG